MDRKIPWTGLKKYSRSWFNLKFDCWQLVGSLWFWVLHGFKSWMLHNPVFFFSISNLSSGIFIRHCSQVHQTKLKFTYYRYYIISCIIIAVAKLNINEIKLKTSQHLTITKSINKLILQNRNNLCNDNLMMKEGSTSSIRNCQHYTCILYIIDIYTS